MRVLFTSIRNTSHFLPLVPFVEACRSRGHEVAVAAPPDLAERVAATGAAFFPFGHPGDEGLRPIWMRLRDASDDELRQIVVGEIFAGACARTALPGLLETTQQWRPSIVVRESQEYASVVATEKLGIPHIRVAITLRSAEAQLLPAAAPAVDAHGRGVGLPPDPSGERMLREPVLTLFPASLELPEPELAQVRRFRAGRKQASSLPEWWGARRGPLVYVTLGTVVGGMDVMRSAYRVALDAVSDLPIRVLLTIGADLPLEALGEVPPNAHVERFVPQDDVLPHAAAVLCHGGSGTVLGTLAAGVPLVVAPMFADQPNNAERIAAVGAGLAMPTRAASAEDLRRALTRVLEEESFRIAAQRLAAEIAALPSVDDAALEIERLARGGTACAQEL
jgi:UDP:flavonoid glycosyltransferase YjiC (YdhE family)